MGIAAALMLFAIVYGLMAMVIGSALGRMAAPDDRKAEDDRQMAYLDEWRRRNDPVVLTDEEVDEIDRELIRLRMNHKEG